MTMEVSTAAELALLGGVLSLDRVAFLQSLVSRPLPTSALAGLLTGEVELALLAGLYLELFWLSRQPVGSSVPPDETLAALASVLAALGAPQGWDLWERAAAGVLVGLPFGLLGRWLEIKAREANAAILDLALERLSSGDMLATGKAQARGALNFLLAGLAGSLLAVLLAGPAAGFVFGLSPQRARDACSVMSVAMPVIGAGALLGSLTGRKPKVVFAAGALGGVAAAKLGLTGLAGFLGRGRGGG